MIVGVNAAPRELIGQHQPGRTGPHDENIGIHFSSPVSDPYHPQTTR